jgi:hypothetical protein
MKLRLAFLLTLTAVAHAAAKPNILLILPDYEPRVLFDHDTDPDEIKDLARDPAHAAHRHATFYTIEYRAWAQANPGKAK